MRKIVILPASIYQVPFVEKAVEMGLYVITIDNRPDNPCHLLSHKQYPNVSTTDYEQIMNICIREKINGILSPCSDISLITVAKVAQIMSLPGPTYECANILTSKILFREFQKSNGFNYPQFQVIDTPKQRSIEFPLIIKPDKSSGSKGVFILNNQEELINKFIESKEYSLNHKVLIEEEIRGHHLTVEGIMYKRRIDKIFISDRITAPPPYVATWGHIMPSIYNQNDEEIKEVKRQIECIFSKLNYTDGPFDADIIINQSSAYIIEITPRIGGNSLTKLIHYAYGFDMVSYNIHHALNTFIDTSLHANPTLTKIKLLGSIDSSIIEYDAKEIEVLKLNKNIKQISIDYPSGSLIQPFINGRNRAGEVIIQASSREEIEQLENLLINPKIKFTKL